MGGKIGLTHEDLAVFERVRDRLPVNLLSVGCMIEAYSP